MTLNTHRELISGSTNSLHGIEVSVLAVSDDQRVLAIVNAVSWGIENLPCRTCQTLGVQRAKAFSASGVTSLAFYSCRVKIEP